MKELSNRYLFYYVAAFRLLIFDARCFLSALSYEGFFASLFVSMVSTLVNIR